MKDKKALALSGLLSLEALLGCGGRYPQYSGQFELQNFSYSKPDFAGKKRLPSDLKIIHRMKYIPNVWDDRLRFEFTPDHPGEIQGAVVFDLENLTRDKESIFPQPQFKGEQIHAEKAYYGGVFCNYQYQYQAFAIVTPGEQELKKVYPEQGEYLYTDPSGMPIYKSFDPDKFEPDGKASKGWYEAIENNQGTIIIDFSISREIRSDTSGCDAESYLPYDSRGKESLRATYYSTKLDDEEDPRVGFDQLLDNSIPPIDLFKEVISEIKDLK
ncbi:MAG: hypothetical protein Q8R47_00370 [Nanoarchaeota archaeon]|nr:hypothetical protein [Nanoarchaeota archaeon]